MWLLDTGTHRLHQWGDISPRYAILSHRWGEQEVSFQDLRNCHMVEDAFSSSLKEEEELFPIFRDVREHRTKRLKSMKGWEKIERLCKEARSYKLDWAWIDTACIDKSSSAELQESINSMYKWYQLATKCFVHMADVTSRSRSERTRQQFRASEWFKRGWTLQELLAPVLDSMVFFNRDWDRMALDKELVDDISSVTKIPPALLRAEKVFSKEKSLRRYSIAQRMSWAAGRQVTRGEDVAYSLMGIFDVNMPLLYGEGRIKAFERLQKEIIRETTDETVLAFHEDTEDATEESQSGLATSPAQFSRCGSYCVGDWITAQMRMIRASSTHLVPRGISMEAVLLGQRKGKGTLLPIALRQLTSWTAEFALPLLCYEGLAPRLRGGGGLIVFVQLDRSWGPNEYVRSGNPFSAMLSWTEIAKLRRAERFYIVS